MDLSMKKPVIALPQDLPQDLSVKKCAPSSDHNSGSLVDQKLSAFAQDLSARQNNNTPSVLYSKLFGIQPPSPQTPMDLKLNKVPDQYSKREVDLKTTTLANQTLRTLAHQKAMTLAVQGKRTSLDQSSRTLVIPKPSALVVPNPRNRTRVSDLPRTKVPTAKTAPLVHKPNTLKTKSFTNKGNREVLDLRRQSDASLPEPKQLPSHEQLPNNGSLHDPIQPFVEDLNSAQPEECSSSVTPLSEDDASLKRRRKQNCPRKRIRLDSYLPEEADPAYLMSEEFLDKVTDAAQNGELSKGLDAYFGSTAENTPGFDDVDTKEDRENGYYSDFGHSSALKDSGDELMNGSPGSPSSLNDSLSLHFKITTQSKKLKLAPSSHVSTSLQNREKRKVLRLYGKAYTTPSGKTYPQRKVRDKDCSKCRYNCSSNITPQQRESIFQHFWSLDSYVKRLYYYCQSIKEKPAKTMKHTRECSREYTFLTDGERVRVCKGFYLATLDVSDKAVRIAMEKRKRGKGMWDKRGAHPPHNKTRPEDKDRVRNHIESFLIIDIYNKTCDNSNTTPGQDLNVTKMHQDYVDQCKKEEREPVSEDVYRKTFNTEYNLSTVQV